MTITAIPKCVTVSGEPCGKGDHNFAVRTVGGTTFATLYLFLIRKMTVTYKLQTRAKSPTIPIAGNSQFQLETGESEVVRSQDVTVSKL